jgi:peptide/nickel transport system permease protein
VRAGRGRPAAPPELGAGRRWRRSRFARPDAAAVVGSVLVAVFVVVAIGAPLLEPHDPLAQDLARRLKPPGYVDPRLGLFALGTDGLGRDVLSRLLAGARVSLVVGVGGALGAGLLGTAVGLSSGYVGGWWDGLVSRLADVVQAIPFTVLALAVIVALGPSLPHLLLVLAATSWVDYSRVVRAETLGQRRSELVLAARVSGASPARIVLRHVLPQVLPSVVVIGSLLVGSMILFEATLSFLGLGVQPPTPSWGNMVLDGIEPIRVAWWVSFFPGLAILLAVLGINLLADWLRDALDPRLG